MEQVSEARAENAFQKDEKAGDDYKGSPSNRLRRLSSQKNNSWSSRESLAHLRSSACQQLDMVDHHQQLECKHYRVEGF